MGRLISGPQAVVELLLAQRRLDQQRGLRTGGFVSGYRGSPLGGYDFALWRERRRLRDAHIIFEPGLNEELAATAVWGSQQIDLYGGGAYDGVFGLWYGKNPGLDRSGDAIKHGNFAAAHRYGGVLAISGDDPGAQSSSIPNQSDHTFIAMQVPVIAPASLPDFLRLGLLGYGLSRYAGLWVGVKAPADLVEGATIFDPMVLLPDIRVPEDFAIPPEGVWPQWPITRWEQDRRLQEVKLPAAVAFARANGMDVTQVIPTRRRRLGLIGVGKAHRDLLEALDLLGLDPDFMAAQGIGVRKVGLVWPLEPRGMTDFAQGFDEVLVVEERRASVETQLKDLAYHWPARQRPVIIGKSDETGRPLIPVTGETTPLMLARLLADRLLAKDDCPKALAARLRDHLPGLTVKAVPDGALGPPRLPHFCAGCPHGRSTRTPDGALAGAGIGCHSLAMWMPGENTRPITQMGGEGTTWIGAEPFVDADHFFQNLGDGTYVHSGSLAIRAAVAAQAKITFKILCNQAVAMTGGQPVEGQPSPEAIAWQLHAEGVAPIYLLRGSMDTVAAAHSLPSGVIVSDRDNLFDVMEQCRRAPGVSAIIYDQICATEKRRLRKKGSGFADEPVVVINEQVCEGCGDCSIKARCVAIGALETDFGVKRWIDDSVCNTDLSCLDGFCPSFVTIHGARPRPHVVALDLDRIQAGLPDPQPAPTAGRQDILVSGVGGTGLVSIGALLADAMVRDGLTCSVLDNTGIARKGGEVLSHLRVATDPEGLAARIPDGRASLLLAGDLAVAAHANSLAKLDQASAHVIALDEPVPAIEQAIDPESPPDAQVLADRLRAATHADRVHLVGARWIARAALGDTIHANQVLLGFALQKGLLPVSARALEASVDAAGVKVSENRLALALGRLAAHDPALLENMLGPRRMSGPEKPAMGVLRRRLADGLAAYQDHAYAARFEDLVHAVIERDIEVMGKAGPLSEAVARNAYRLMAYKDEYEVARLLVDPAFLESLSQRYDGRLRLNYHLSPPFLTRWATVDGRGEKRRFGPWMGVVFKGLAGLRFLRGTVFDPFGYQAERREERRLIDDYEARMHRALAILAPDNYEQVVALARLPEGIKGFGPVKARNMADVRARTRILEAALFEGEEAN